MPSSDGVYFLLARRCSLAPDKRRHSRELFTAGTDGGSHNCAQFILEGGKHEPTIYK